jgi:hypothetical protein
MAGDRPLCEEQLGRDLTVRATFSNQHSDASLGGRQPLLTPAAADAPKLAACFLGPVRSPELLETIERDLDRIAGVPFLSCPPPDHAEPEQRSSLAEGISDILVLLDRLFEEGGGARNVALSGKNETTASSNVRQNPAPGDPRGVRFPDVDDSNRIVDPTVLEKHLGVVGRPPSNTRLAPPELRGALLGLLKPFLGRGRIPAPSGNEPKDRHELHGASDELLLSEVETSFRVLPRQVELSAMDGDDRSRQLVLRHLDPVLDRDVAGASRVLGPELPTSSPELNPGETP